MVACGLAENAERKAPGGFLSNRAVTMYNYERKIAFYFRQVDALVVRTLPKNTQLVYVVQTRKPLPVPGPVIFCHRVQSAQPPSRASYEALFKSASIYVRGWEI